MAVSLAVHEIFSVKEMGVLENWVRGCSRSLKITPFDTPYTTFYWSAIVTINTKILRSFITVEAHCSMIHQKQQKLFDFF